MRVFDHAAAGGDGRCRDKIEMGVGGANSVREDEGHVFVEADGGGGESLIFETFGKGDVGALVFLPGEDIDVAAKRSAGEQLVGAAFFKRGADEERLGAGRKDESPEALSAIEVQVSEVDRGTGGIGEDDGIDLVSGHQGASALDAGHALGVSEWARLTGEIGEGRNGGRGGWRCLPGMRWKCGGGDGGGGGTEKIATSERGIAGQGNGPPGDLRRGFSRVMVAVSFQLDIGWVGFVLSTHSTKTSIGWGTLGSGQVSGFNIPGLRTETWGTRIYKY